MKLIVILEVLRVKHKNVVKMTSLMFICFLFKSCFIDYEGIIEYEIENNLSTTVFYKIESSGCGLNPNGSGFPNSVHDSVKPYSTKMIFRECVGINTRPKQSEYTCIKELLLYTLNGNDTVKSNVDYSKNQNMEYYYRDRGKTIGVCLIKVDSTNFTIDW
jgi:hypothetical protein